MRIAIIVPTTAGPSLIRKLRPLHTAPRSLVFTQSDYKPLEISARYNDFLQPGGPLAGALGMEDTRFELRLSARVESGRSWELPVALAHWALAQGHEIVSDKADMVIWATGALDSDLSIIAQDYHLDSKIAQSRASVAETLRPGGQALLLTPEPCTGGQLRNTPALRAPSRPLSCRGHRPCRRHGGNTAHRNTERNLGPLARTVPPRGALGRARRGGARPRGGDTRLARPDIGKRGHGAAIGGTGYGRAARPAHAGKRRRPAD